jgi:hypothetical protein
VFSLVLLGLLVATHPPLPQEQAPRSQESDLDAFMKKVLARREVNRKTLDQYVLDEVEQFEILGPGRVPLHRSKREFTWYVRDGRHVRSPVKFNGVSVGDEDRDRYEENWIRREKERIARRAKKEQEQREKEQEQREKERQEKGTEPAATAEQDKKERGEIVISPGGVHVDTGAPVIPTEPRFVSEAYFMDFKFEPGNYYLAGREQLEGQEVLRIEYYPTRLFDDEDKKTPREMRRKNKPGEVEEDIDRRMNKTALITLWVDPKEHQIVKYTFENVWLDFLPAAWLVRIDELRASMTMGQPFPGIWLPRGIEIGAGLTLAVGSFEAGYERRFDEYREAATSYKIRIPKGGR